VQSALRGILFDIIIDDGLHSAEGQWRTFAALRPHLKPTGVYVVEDVFGVEPERFTALDVETRFLRDRSGQGLLILYPPQSLARQIDLT
jgi:hypothetical protein